MKNPSKKIVTAVLSSAMFFSTLAPSASAKKYYYDNQTDQYVSEDELDLDDVTVIEEQIFSGRYTLIETTVDRTSSDDELVAPENGTPSHDFWTDASGTLYINRQGAPLGRSNVYRSGNYSDNEVIPLSTFPKTSKKIREEKKPFKNSKIKTTKKKKCTVKPKTHGEEKTFKSSKIKTVKKEKYTVKPKTHGEEKHV